MTTVWEIIFWVCMGIVVYTYVGYGILLYFILKIRRMLGFHRLQPVLGINRDLWPEVTLMVCAYNEEEVVEMKMNNTHQLDYPASKLHLLWVTDGSNDKTNALLSAYPEVEVLYQPQRQGKTAALNRGIAHAQTEIIIMTDANTLLNSGAIQEIARLFQDPTVGCVAGEKRVMARADEQTAAKGEGAYWKYESTLKRWDSELFSAMGAAGELCAVRKHLYQPMPQDTLLDDFIMSMRITAQGHRIAYSKEAYAMEYGSADIKEEGKRKQRIAAGGLQSIWRLKRLMNPLVHPMLAFQFVSHRVLRWSITPIALLALIPLNVVLVFQSAGWIYTALWIAQIIFYLLAFIGYLMEQKGKASKLFYIPYYFLFMNINVFRGMKYLASHRNSGAWEKAKRG